MTPSTAPSARTAELDPRRLTGGSEDPVGGSGVATVGARSAGATGAVVAWAVLISAALVWGARTGGPDVSLRAAPLMGHWDWRAGRGLVPAAAIGGAVAWWGPRAAGRLSWTRLLGAVSAVSAAWTVALAAADGWAQVTRPLTTRHEYEPLAARVDDLGTFVATYVERLPDRPIHVQGHPPGGVVVAHLLDTVGLGGAGWLAALVVAAWAGAAVAALVAARAVTGEGPARRAAPALAVLPAAVWAGTSLDALFAGVGAVATALATVAATRGSARSAAAAGAAFGVALLLTYGAALLAVVLVAAVSGAALANASDTAGAVRRTVATLVAVAGAALAVLVAVAAAGFSWIAGLDATRHAYWSGVAAHRPAAYLTLVGNPAAFALAAGPAVAAGWASLRARPRPRAPAPPPARTGHEGSALRRWSGAPLLLPAAAVVAVVAADLSQHARGEVERIWVLFVPWVALAAPGDRRRWVAGQVAVALVLQAVLRSPW